MPENQTNINLLDFQLPTIIQRIFRKSNSSLVISSFIHLRLIISAQINFSIIIITSMFSILLSLIKIFRIVYGALTYHWLVAYHYIQRGGTVSFLFMLASRVVIKLFFILDFERMSAITEKQVIICFSLITIICTGLHLVHEYLLRNQIGLNHFPRMVVYVWLGMVKIIKRIYENIG